MQCIPVEFAFVFIRITPLTHSVFVLKDGNIRQFLEEGTALDPRFKPKVTNEVWTRLEEELMKMSLEQVLIHIGNLLLLLNCRSICVTYFFY